MFSLVQLLTYIFVVAFTPGPNTLMVMSSGIRFGLRRTLPFIAGILFAQTFLIALMALFSKVLLDALPGAEPFMRVLGAAYMLYLAYKIWRSKGVQEGETQKDEAPSFAAGMLLQFVNVKLFLFFFTALSTYILPYFSTFSAIAPKAALLLLCDMSACILWASFGSLFRGFYNSHTKLVNAIMALAVVYCAVALFL